MQLLPDRSIEQVRKAHRQVLAHTTTALAEQLTLAGEHAVNHVKAYPGFKPRTGKLQAGTEWRTVRTSNGRILQVKNKVKYAASIDGGARPHMIAASRARALSFMWKGHRIFRRYVMHPGNRPYKFLYKATVSAGRVFHQGMAAQMGRIAKQF